jgi:L-alanine-DL-glutamate epimerase-like enolase superfamily enzyme
MLKARFQKHILQFRQPAGTSRGVMHDKVTWFIHIWDERDPGTIGVGECSLLPGLSSDDRPGYESRIEWLCNHIGKSAEELYRSLVNWPSIRFGLEMALLDLANGGRRILFPSPFTESGRPVAINGLVWMGDKDFMFRQIEEKLNQGFRVIKMKVGAIDFESECDLLAHIRGHYDKTKIELRLDANGAFSAGEAVRKLERLAKYDIHSIEQPISAGQVNEMALICKLSPIPVALDEELIGVHYREQKAHLLDIVRPDYIILKPSMLGGFEACKEWIELAGEINAGWWITSALESNIGLNAIAQWTATLGNPLPQGLGTGSLYLNNIPSPLVVAGGCLHFNPDLPWDYTFTGLPATKKNDWDYPLTLNGVVRTGPAWAQASGELNDTPMADAWYMELIEFLHQWFSDEETILVRTSGSTGEPKDIRLQKTAMIRSAVATGRELGLSNHPDALLCLSTRYIAGMMMVVRAMVYGHDLVPVKPDGNPLLHLSGDRTPSFAAMVPAQVYNALKDPVSLARLKEIKTLIIGGGEIHPALERELQQIPNRVYATYGMTETITHIALRRVNGTDRKEYFTALPGVVLSTDGRGCLVINSPGILQAEQVTNDLAELLGSREFRWLGRVDNVINRGGQKIIPEEIERRLINCLKERFFIGAVPDDKFGRLPVLFVESEEPDTSEKERIIACVEKYTSRTERPVRIYYIPKFTETENGKINRFSTLKLINL